MIDYCSHKGVLLKNHLKSVSEMATSFMDYLNIDNIEYLKKAAGIIGLTHDFGKYTTFFQDRLLKGLPKSLLNSHSFISALFTAYCLQNAQCGNIYTLCGYFSVLHHHGELLSYDEDILSPVDLEEGIDKLDRKWNERLKNIEIQLKDISSNIGQIEMELSEIGLQVSINGFINNYDKIIPKLHQIKKNIDKTGEDKEMLFIYSQFLFSILVDADKKEASKLTATDRKCIPENIVEEYKKINPFKYSPMSNIRDNIFNEVKEIANKIYDEKILTLTAPAGGGKTLTALNAALIIKKKENLHGRIIYALPFTSIIDQNFNDIGDVLKTTVSDYKQNSSKYMIKHHHLSDMKYIDDSDELPVGESVMLTESWESEIIVTTFIQIFDTIIGYKNKLLKKYHTLSESVIILDEVQNIDVKYWDSIRYFIKLVTKYLNCRVIFMTATKPLIFKDEDVKELLPNHETYFKRLKRVRIIPHADEISVDDFAAQVAEIGKNSSTMVVLNTIRESLMIYYALKDKKMDVEYLSSAIVPINRKIRIKKIKGRLKRREKFILVTTQLVEAGINFDFDTVVRDIGPVDSVIQCCGRANRNMERDRADVHLFCVADDNGTPFGIPIYGSVHISAAKESITSTVNEEDFLSIIKKYYIIINEKANKSVSESLIKAAMRCSFSTSKCDFKCLICPWDYICKFSLIEERQGYVDVFIEKNYIAKKILQKYIEMVLNEKDYIKKKENELKLRARLRWFVISVPKKATSDCIELNSNLKLLPMERLNGNYSKITGFNMKGVGGLIF